MPREAFNQSINDQIRLGNNGGPAPNAYLPREPERFSHVKGTKFSDAQVPSYLDIPVQRAQDLGPGPGAYGIGTEGPPLPAGGHWNPMPQPHFKLANHSEGAEPGTYDPKLPQHHAKLAKFTSKEARGAEGPQDRETRQVPGPGAYDDVDAYENYRPFLPEGGRTLDAPPNKSYFDEVAKSRADQVVGKYDVSKGFIVEPAGQPVYRYESSTIKQTQALVKQVSGHDNPGPGAYNLPGAPGSSIQAKPPPGAVPFHGLGRDNQYALPPPFNYNCPKDYTRRYYQPVLAAGTGDAIYGRFDHSARSSGGRGPPRTLEPLDTGSDFRHSSRSAEVDAIRAARLAREAEKKKYRSTLHPQCKQAAKTYKDLSGKKLQATDKLLPMASKRVVEIGTTEDDPECQAYERHRAKLHAAAELLDGGIQDLLEPLDTSSLLASSGAVMAKKVEARMRRDGVPNEKRELLRQELPSVLDDSFHEPPGMASLPGSPAASPPKQPSPKKASPKGKAKGKAVGIEPSPKESPVPVVADTFELSAGSPDLPSAYAGAGATLEPSTALDGTAQRTAASPAANFASIELGAGSPPSSSPGLGDGAHLSSIELGQTDGALVKPADLTFGEGTGDLTFEGMAQNSFDKWREGDSTQEVTKEEQLLRDAFRASDADQDGLISVPELKVGMEQAGSTPTDEQVQRLFLLGDADRDGKITFDEYRALLLSGLEKQEFEIDADGFMAEPDLQRVCAALHPGSEELLPGILAQLELGGGGKASYYDVRRALLADMPAAVEATMSPGTVRRVSRSYTGTLIGAAVDGELGDAPAGPTEVPPPEDADGTKHDVAEALTEFLEPAADGEAPPPAKE